MFSSSGIHVSDPTESDDRQQVGPVNQANGRGNLKRALEDSALIAVAHQWKAERAFHRILGPFVLSNYHKSLD